MCISNISECDATLFSKVVVLSYSSTSSIYMFLLLQIFSLLLLKCQRTVTIGLFAYLVFNIETFTNLGNTGFKNWVNFPLLSEVFYASFHEQEGALCRRKSKLQSGILERALAPPLTSFMMAECSLPWGTDSHPYIMMWRCLTHCLAHVKAQWIQVSLCFPSNSAPVLMQDILNMVHWSALWWITQRQLSLRTNKAFVCVAAGQPVAKLLWLILMCVSPWCIYFEAFWVVSFHFHTGAPWILL